jgi:hypothetical protein
MIKGIPFLIGCWVPYVLGLWGGLEFPVSATVVVAILVATKTMKAI